MAVCILTLTFPKWRIRIGLLVLRCLSIFPWTESQIDSMCGFFTSWVGRGIRVR